MKIEATQGRVILADDSDYELLSAYSWYVVKTTGGRLYAHARVPGTGKRVSMHRLLMDAPRGSVVHHKDNDGLNNKRDNLETTSNQKNILYAFDGREVGVHFHKQTGKWRAQLRGPNGRFVSLGLHETREKAVFAATTFRNFRTESLA